jgi:DMSO reductase anchor subunit
MLFLAVFSIHSMSRLSRHLLALLLRTVEMHSNITGLQFLLLLGQVYNQDAVVKWTYQDDLNIRELTLVHTHKL